MDMNAMEARIQALEAQVKMGRAAQDRAEVANLFGRFQYLHSMILDDQIMDDKFYAQHQPDVRKEDPNGYLEGLENIAKYHSGRPRHKGKLIVHPLTNPVIEVAGDGQTAKGVWITTGLESGVFTGELPDYLKFLEPSLLPADENGLRKWVLWVWQRYAVDFIKEDGVWRIWHLHGYDVMAANFYEDWISYSVNGPKREMLGGQMVRPDGLHHPDACGDAQQHRVGEENHKHKSYSIDQPVYDKPRLPEPYYTFSDTFSY